MLGAATCARRPSFPLRPSHYVTDLLLRPRSVSELVDAAFALYRRHSRQYILVAALANAPLLILQLLLPDANPFSTVWSVGPRLFVAAASLVTFSVMSAVVVRLGSQVYLGEEPDLARTVTDVLPRVPALLVAGLLKGVLQMLGVLCFFVGWLYVIARYFAVSTVIVLEGKGPIAALGRSSELSINRKRHILNTLLLVGLIYFVLSFGVSALAQLLNSEVLQVVLATIFTIVAYSLFALTELTLYYDARIRGEGFDMEHMAAALDSSNASVAIGGTTR